MNGYIPPFVGFLGALLFAIASGTWRGNVSATWRGVLAWLGIAGLAFAVTVYVLALMGAVVFTS